MNPWKFRFHANENGKIALTGEFSKAFANGTLSNQQIALRSEDDKLFMLKMSN